MKFSHREYLFDVCCFKDLFFVTCLKTIYVVVIGKKNFLQGQDFGCFFSRYFPFFSNCRQPNFLVHSIQSRVILQIFVVDPILIIIHFAVNVLMSLTVNKTFHSDYKRADSKMYQQFASDFCFEVRKD